MKDFRKLLALPASLLAFIACAEGYTSELQWPYNVPRTIKYYPEHEAHVKRELEAQEKLAWQTPVAVRKMGNDVGEKFFLQYWRFEGMDPRESPADVLDEISRHGNASMGHPLHPPIALHSRYRGLDFSIFGRSLFARDASCPLNYHSCSGSGFDNLCCDTGETCISASGGGACCPDGETCGGPVGTCQSGYTPCNGGCCIPGAVCKGSVCIIYGTQTVTTTLPTVTKTSGLHLSTVTGDGRTVTVYQPTVSVSEYTTTETVTLRPSGNVTTETLVSSEPAICKYGYYTCPPSLGGGCCLTGQACATGTHCPDITTTTTVTPIPGVQVTSVSSKPSTSHNTANCPIGYYQCSAHYLGGCCRVERNCDTASCPPADSTVLVNSRVTIIQSAPTSVRGHCAGGWYSCGAAESGGCCPHLYTCGLVSCTPTVSGYSDTAKMSPGGASNLQWAWSLVLLAFTAGVGMILL